MFALLGVVQMALAPLLRALGLAAFPGSGDGAVVARYRMLFGIWGVVAIGAAAWLLLFWRRAPPPRQGSATMAQARAAQQRQARRRRSGGGGGWWCCCGGGRGGVRGDDSDLEGPLLPSSPSSTATESSAEGRR